MIILLGNGGLGNQLFQYSFIKRTFPRDLTILFGFDDLAKLCDLGNAFVIPQNYFGKITYKILRYAISFLGILRLISGVEEDVSGPDFKLTKKYGLIFNLILIKNSFFQHEKFNDHLPLNLEINDQHIQRAKKLINQISTLELEMDLVFIHIRRGDYVEWPSPQLPAVLPSAWVFNGIRYFREKLESPFFLVFTDDRQYVEDVFGGEGDIVMLSRENPATDFALMSLCNYGIMSASTFSWWAANFSRKRCGDKCSYEFIAPNFWAGHAAKKWFPPNFYTKWLKYFPSN